MSCNSGIVGGRRRKTRKVRGGAGYGFGNPVTVGTLEVVPNSTSTPYSSSTGAAVPDPYATTGNSSTLMGGRRRKSRKGKSKKGGKRKSKKTNRRSRKMRGGMHPGSVNSAPVGAGFVGGLSGVSNGTYGTYAGYPQNVPAGNPHPVGADGVTKV